MKKLRKWLSGIVTGVLLIVLFGVIFVNLGLVQLSPSYFIELAIVASLLIIVKTTWYDSAEENRLERDDIKSADNEYDDMVDSLITDVDDFEKFLLILDQENKERYIKAKMGTKSAYKFGRRKYARLYKKYKRQAFKLYKSMSKEDEEKRKQYIEDKLQGETPESLGEAKYLKRLTRVQNRADKIKPLNSSDVITRGECKKTYDTKNYQRQKKRVWEISSTIMSVALSIGLAAIAFKELMLNWGNAFRYCAYVYSILQTIVMTLLKANKNTYNEHIDHLSRLTVILKKYEKHKEGGSSSNGGNNNI